MRLNTQVVTLLVLLSGLAACSQAPVKDNEMERWFGRPAAELVKVWGSPKSIVKLEEKRLEYKYPRPEVDESCVHYWLMNRQGYVIAHRTEGRCG